MERTLIFLVLACKDAEWCAKLGEVLRQAGYVVLKAQSADEVLRLAALPAHVVLLQGSLVTVARHLKSDPFLVNIPVIVLADEACPHADRTLPSSVSEVEVLTSLRELIAKAPSLLPRPILFCIRELIDGLIAHVAILDSRGVILAVNDAWRTFALQNGGNPARLSEGANYLQTCKHLCVSEGESIHTFSDRLNRVLKGELESFSHEYPCHSPEEFRWFVAHVRRIRVAGTSFVLVSHENITNRKVIQDSLDRIEHRFYELLISISTGILVLDDQSRVVFCNPAIEELLGCPRSRLLERSLWEAIPELAKSTLPKAISGVLCNKSSLATEFFHPTTGIWIELVAHSNGSAIFVQLRNVTQQVQARLVREQQEANRVKQIERELLQLQQIISIPRQNGHSERLRDSVPELFREWIAYYKSVLDLALEQRVYRVSHQTSKRLKQLADQLCRANATPRDLIEIHTQAIQSLSSQATALRAQTYLEEGRLLLVELIGLLAPGYRALPRDEPCS